MRTAVLIVDCLLEDHHLDRAVRNHPDIDPELISTALKYDPAKGGYLDWIVGQMKLGKVKMPEDGPKTEDLLYKFTRLKNQPKFAGDKNVYNYRTYADLAKAVRAAGPTKGELERVQAHEGSRLSKQLGPLKLYQVTTPEASAALSRGTEWCIRFSDYYKHYAKKGPVYIITKNDRPYVGFVPASEQIRDIDDENASDALLKEIIPIVYSLVPKVHPSYVKKARAEYPARAEAFANRLLAQRAEKMRYNGKLDHEIQADLKRIKPVYTKYADMMPDQANLHSPTFLRLIDLTDEYAKAHSPENIGHRTALSTRYFDTTSEEQAEVQDRLKRRNRALVTAVLAAARQQGIQPNQKFLMRDAHGLTQDGVFWIDNADNIKRQPRTGNEPLPVVDVPVAMNV